jgi:hypothetical protein
VTSFFRRYASGEHEQVWSELRALGPVPAELREDVEAVAGETMRRVATHVRRLADALPSLGLVPSRPTAPLHRPATDDELVDLSRLAEEIGGLPAALVACMREVGEVSFLGDCPALEVSYHRPTARRLGMPPGAGWADPLLLPGADYLRFEWNQLRSWNDPGRFCFDFAPDELTKFNVSGSSHDIYLPELAADPLLHKVAGRPGVTLVEYLRMSISWGGFAGWSFAPTEAPAALAGLRVVPDF